MLIVLSLVALAIRLYTLVLIGRIIIEMIQSFSRSFRPPRWFAIIAEPMFMVTDPPVRALRRVIPPLRLGGGIGLDLSVLVLFLILMVLRAFVAIMIQAVA